MTRKKGESIEIGDDVKVVVTEIKGDKVRIGVDAPVHVTVHRSEVANAIRRSATASTRLIDLVCHKCHYTERRKFEGDHWVIPGCPDCNGVLALVHRLEAEGQQKGENHGS